MENTYFINNEWMTWDQAHSLGYTKLPSLKITLYNSNLDPVIVRQDQEDHTFYDETNKTWVTDIQSLNLFYKLGNRTYYLCDTELQLDSYSNISADIVTHVLYNDSLLTVGELYSQHGITTNKCSTFFVKNGELLVWYDPDSSKYWDNREGYKSWNSAPPDLDEGFPEAILTKINIPHLTPQLHATVVSVPDLSDKKAILAIPTSDLITRMYVTNESGIDINGIHYNFADALTYNTYRYSKNLTIIEERRSTDLFGDSAIHSLDEINSVMSQYSLSYTFPVQIIVGQTTTLPSIFTSMPKTNWYWCGGFSAGSTDSGTNVTNWYTSSTYAQNPFPMIDTPWVTVGDGNKYRKAILSNNSLTVELTSLIIGTYNSAPQIYCITSASISRNSTRANNTVIVLCNDSLVPYKWSLPSDLYTLNGSSITWNTSSKFYKPFNGLNILS